MATYVNNLRLTELATGEGSGTWGTTTNTSLELIGEALGYNTQNCFSSDADATTTIADGATDPARAFYFKVTSSATLTATRTLTIAPNTISRVMFIENATTGSQSITISQGSGANVTIATGKTAVVYLDGAGSGAAVVDAMANVDPGVTDTLAEVLVAGNTSGGTGLTMSSGDDLTLTGASYNVVWDSSDSALEFADNAKAIFGTGGDLEIYHNASNSYIDDAGTGGLVIRSSQVNIGKYTGETAAVFTADGSVQLRYDNSAKFETTSTGVDITGTAVTDGVTVDGVLGFVANASFPTTGLVLYTNNYLYQRGGSSGIIFSDASGTNEIARFTPATVTFNEDSNDQDFRVESNGATHMLFIDGGTNRVGIGESAPDTPLHLTTSSTGTAVTIESTGGNSASGPDLVLYRNSSSPLADDALGSIKFRGEDSGGATNDYAQIISSLVDPTAGSEDGLMTLQTIVAGTNRNRLTINSTELNINESSRDVDFRVESDNNAHMLFVDGGTDRVGIGQSSPAYKLDVSTSTTGDGIRVFSAGATPPSIDIGSTRGASADVVLAEINGQWDGGEVASIKFESGDDTTNKDDGRISFYTAVSNNSVAERMRIEMDGSIGVGTDSPTSLLHLSKATGGAGSDPIEINIDSTHNGNWTADSDWGHINFRAPNESSTPDGDTHIQIAANAGSSTSGAVNDAVLRIKNVSGTLSERMRWDYDGTISFSDKDGSETARINNDGNFLLGTTTVAYAGTLLNIGTTSDTQNGVQIQTSTTGNGYILFGDGSGADAYRGQIQYEHTDDKLTLRSGGAIRQNLSSTEAVFNEGSTDTDFRVESDGNSNMIFVDASIDSVGIGTGSPSTTYALDVAGAVRSSGSAPGYTLLESDASNQQYILGSYAGTLALRDVTGGTYPFQITTGAPTNSILIQSGSVTVNDNSADQDFRVESNGNANIIFVDAGSDKVSIGSSSVDQRFNVYHDTSASAGIHVENLSTGTAARTMLDLRSDGGNFFMYATGSNYNGVTGWADSGVLSTSSSLAGGIKINSQAGGITLQDALVSRFEIKDGSETVVNEDGQDRDFRIESSSTANQFFLDAGTGLIGVNTGTPDAHLDVNGAIGYTKTASRNISAGSVNNNYHVIYDLDFASSGFSTNQHFIRIIASGPTSGQMGSADLIVTFKQQSGNKFFNIVPIQNDNLTLGYIWDASGGGTSNGNLKIYAVGPAAYSYLQVYATNRDANPDDNILAGTFPMTDTGSTSAPAGMTTIESPLNYSGNKYNQSGRVDNTFVINEQSHDINFRVESNSNTQALLVDGGGDFVAMGNTVKNPVSGFADQHGFGFNALNGDCQIASDSLPLELGRTTTGGGSGTLMQFRAESVSVGVIGTDASNIYIGTGDTTLKMDASNNGIFPRGTNGAQRDGSIQLGSPGNRFTDLYLSGGVYVGGTGSANHLDDYEEGTWTPTYQGSSTAGTGTYTRQSGTYVKVGNLVYASGTIGISAHTGSGNAQIAGLPFGSFNNTGNYAAVSISFNNGHTTTSGYQIIGFVQIPTTTIYLYETGGTGQQNPLALDTGFTELDFTIVYRAS